VNHSKRSFALTTKEKKETEKENKEHIVNTLIIWYFYFQ